METIRSIILSPVFGGPPYLAFSLLLMACSLGFPFSSDITLITAGILAGAGVFELKKTILLGLAAILFGDSIAFFAGRRFGSRIVKHRYFLKLCPPQKFEEISGFLKLNSAKFIFMVRFTPVMRSVIFVTAGTVGVRPSIFFKMNFLSTAIYVPSIISLSYFAANRAEELVQQFQTYNRVITISVVTILVLWMIQRRRKKRIAIK